MTQADGSKFTLEGEPETPILGLWGNLVGVKTPGTNGYLNSDNPNYTTVKQQGQTLVDPDCSIVNALLNLAPTDAFNKISGSRLGLGWAYNPIPASCIAQVCANSNSYASFLLLDVGLGVGHGFGTPPDAPGWNSLGLP